MRLSPIVLLCIAACARNRDAEAQTLVDDLRSLDDAAEEAVHTSPNESGLEKAEALVRAKEADLHTRVLALQSASLTPAASTAWNAASAKNVLSAQNVRDDVYNAVLKTNPPLRARANKLALELCAITETPTYATQCAPFRNPPAE